MRGSFRRSNRFVCTVLFSFGLARGADPSTGAEDKTIFLSSHTARQVAKVRPEPEYPATARQFRLSADVVAEFTVGLDGKVEKVAITQGHPMFNSAVIAAVKRWAFDPYMVDGHPMKFRSTLTFNFKL
jgi:TonB family protein